MDNENGQEKMPNGAQQNDFNLYGEIKMPVERRGGRRPGAGRPRSRVRALTREIANQCAKEGITPLEFMIRVMRDEQADLQTRANMAKAAAPYMHPRLQAVEHSGEGRGPFKDEVKFSVSFEGDDDGDDLDTADDCVSQSQEVRQLC
jgi:hypothetical protein